ncbi:MAG: asparaginase [Veillonellaceae bacterium]|nr:asparaginase [Veillonellaceae bacterium]
MNGKKIALVTTGGTIAMKLDPATGGLVPAVSGDDLIAAVPALKEVAAVEVHESSNVPSGHITPELMLKIGRDVDALAAREDIDGVVITHGTDTMEETAYLLNLTIHTEKPVAITGAMRGATDMGYDGPGNILAAVRTAASNQAAGKGVLLVLNDEIHAANEVTKTHTVSCSTFHSPMAGPIGHVYYDGVVINRQPTNLQKIYTDHLETNVELLKVTAGMSDFLFRACADKPVAGLVVEALGAGNVPPTVRDGIEYVRSKGIPVVLASRVGTGRVVPIYTYLGSAGDMAQWDLIDAGQINGAKARLKLMAALTKTQDIHELQRLFAERVD